MDVNLHPDICRQKNFLLLASSGNRFAAAVPRLLHIKGRVKCIKVLGIQVIGDYAERFAKPLIMNHFPLSQEANGIRHLRILYQAQNIVVGDSCFLFCCNHVRTHLTVSIKMLRNSNGFQLVHPLCREFVCLRKYS